MKILKILVGKLRGGMLCERCMHELEKTLTTRTQPIQMTSVFKALENYHIKVKGHLDYEPHLVMLSVRFTLISHSVSVIPTEVYHIYHVSFSD